jgi:hypothetical protein
MDLQTSSLFSSDIQDAWRVKNEIAYPYLIKKKIASIKDIEKIKLRAVCKGGDSY